MKKRAIVLVLILAALGCIAAAASAATREASSARAGKHAAARHKMLLGLMDDALFQYQTDTAFAAVQALHPQIIRYDADWPLVAKRRPVHPRNPNDPAYDWTKTDEIVRRATALGIPMVLSIVHTPTWAGGGRKHNQMPLHLGDLQSYAYAIAKRYSGKWRDANGELLPRVSRWIAWNEPNTEAHLYPQFIKKGGNPRVKCSLATPVKKCVMVSPREYVKLLKMIYTGVHQAGKAMGVSETVAGGVTKPLGQGPHAFEPSVAPLKFLRALGALHATFDVYAHHPYRSNKNGTPSFGDNVGFDALPKLFATLDKYWPRKHFHLWITEYGVQTNPPDRFIGIAPSKQASILRQNVLAARRNPRIDMMIWFLIRDEATWGQFASGFQTGLEYVNGRLKPAYSVFRSLAR